MRPQPGFDVSLVAMVRAIGKSDALGSVILLSAVVLRELNGRYVPVAVVNGRLRVSQLRAKICP